MPRRLSLPGAGKGLSVAGIDTVSYWAKSTQGIEYPPSGEADCDVAVLGGGIVGVTTALLLAREGAKVALLEARRIGSGATGNTTAKLSSLHGLTYADLASKLGAGVARTYGEANEAGISLVSSLVDELGIDCDLRRKPNFTYTEDHAHTSQLIDEVRAAEEAGLPASFVTNVDELPYEVPAAVRFDGQAEFHPLRYLHALAAAAADAGCAVHERSRVVSVAQGEPCEVKTEHGATLRARHVVVATHLPILDRGLYFARNHPERSYVVLARLRGDVPQGMYLSDESTAHSLRSVQTPDGELLMVGGESHRVGEGDELERYRDLEEWTRERFDVESIEHRWATQDLIPNDKLPFVGRLWPFSAQVTTATGMRKWGLAMGTTAAAMLSDRALGRDNALDATFDPMRLHPLAAAPSLAKGTATVGFHFFRDRLQRGSADALAPGEGAVVGDGLHQRAVFRDDDGKLHERSARCTHLGCIVRFNDAERSWDCPCHGSRFGVDGEVLEGPAVRPLPPAG